MPSCSTNATFFKTEPALKKADFVDYSLPRPRTPVVCLILPGLHENSETTRIQPLLRHVQSVSRYRLARNSDCQAWLPVDQQPG
jgi:hypothetical protein